MSFETLSFSEIPESFQEGVMGEIASIIKKDESLQMVGFPGSGSSLIVRALIQSPKIQKKYFGNAVDNYFFVRLDGTQLLERKAINFSRLFLSLFMPGETIPYDEIEINKRLDEKILEICESKKLVIVFDHLGEMDFPEFRTFFINLNQIYRRHEPKISMIFVSTTLRSTQKDLENFGVLGRAMIQNIIKTPVFNERDALWFIGEREKQMGIKLKGAVIKRIIKLSGGYPRTIKRLVELLERSTNIEEIENNPEKFPSLCSHLNELLGYKNELPEIPILEKLLAREDRSKNFVEDFSGITLKKRLTKNEAKLLSYLSKNNGNLVDREGAIEHLWGEDALGVSDHAYDQIILRLRKKLESSTPKVRIETVRGRGHVLTG